jgi:hypothetical protein
MLRGSSFYLAVTIPDAISIYGMPRLLRWVKDIPAAERPKLLGYVLNTLNRAGGGGSGMSHSQAGSEFRLRQSIQPSLDASEKAIVGDEPCLGAIPRLDVVLDFLVNAISILPWTLASARRDNPLSIPASRN